MHTRRVACIVRAMRRVAFACLVLISTCVVSTARAALGPDDLVLVVNRNVPESRALAEHYAKVRHVPDGRIVELDVPFGEGISRADYVARIAAPLKNELQTRRLAGARCAVLFYGLPFRIDPPPPTESDKQEQAELAKLVEAQTARVKAMVLDLEAFARQVAPAAKLGGGDQVAQLGQRGEMAAVAALQAISRRPPAQRGELVAQFRAIFVKHDADPPAVVATQPSTRPRMDPQRLNALLARQDVAANRAELRKMVADAAAPIDQLRVLSLQQEVLTPDRMAASVDSELSLLWWDDYPLVNWINNPLSYAARNPPPAPVLMTMRIDAPTPELAKRIIDDAVTTEITGLAGLFAVDSRGIPATNAQGQPDGYGVYDQQLRDLAVLLKAKTKLDVRHDDRSFLFEPNSLDGIACYVGWYSVRNYAPMGKYVRGSVAFHVASYEMVVLHQPDQGWVRGLLNDGVAATLGPTSEPFLTAFPRPDDFFPLLLTGELTLAEVYWRTVPWTSWKMSMIGDPLYRPYAKSPAMRWVDLPERIRQAIPEPTTRPATQPGR
jgi:uncharacterized protein (TIGR03790 family)